MTDNDHIKAALDRLRGDAREDIPRATALASVAVAIELRLLRQQRGAGCRAVSLGGPSPSPGTAALAAECSRQRQVLLRIQRAAVEALDSARYGPGPLGEILGWAFEGLGRQPGEPGEPAPDGLHPSDFMGDEQEGE